MPPKGTVKKASAAAATGGGVPKTSNKRTSVPAVTGGHVAVSTAPAVRAPVIKKTAESERKKKQDVAAAKREETARKKVEREAAKKKKQEEVARKKAEREAAKKKKQEEAARKKTEKEEAKKKKQEEAARKKGEKKAKQAKPKAWQFSDAKKNLLLDIKEGLVTLEAFDAQNNPLGTKAEDVYQMRPEFQHYPFDKFQEYLESARDSIVENKSRAVRDAEIVAQFRSVHSKPTKNHRGEPCWEGSEAERALKKAMDEGQHKKMRPKALQKTNPHFQNYNNKTFSSHIEQETRARKFKTWLKDKNEKNKKKLGRGE